MPDKIIVVEDEQEIADLVEIYLKNEGYEVFKFSSGKEACRFADSHRADLAVLDLMLPDTDGFSVCRTIREKHTWPIIMLTAKDGEIDKITGLAMGADDYITKPFRPMELVARVKAQLRRYKQYNSPREEADCSVIVHYGLVMNVKNHDCSLNEKTLALTPTEFEILRILLEHRGEVISAERLFREIWKDEYFSKSNNTITVHIRHLREKMNDTTEHPKYIKTIWGVGYKI